MVTTQDNQDGGLIESLSKGSDEGVGATRRSSKGESRIYSVVGGLTKETEDGSRER